MSVESVVDDVKARLARKRQERPMRSMPMMADQDEQLAGFALDLQDLDAIARRHRTDGERAGQLAGYKRGREDGEVHGGQVRHAQDMQTLGVVADVLRERLERIPVRLAVPETASRDPRTKDELREEAVSLVDEIRACFGVLLAAVVQGAFDEGS